VPDRLVQPLVAGYHAQWPLEPAELELLLDLVRTRLALSAVLGAWQHSRDPGNGYLQVSQAPVGRLLRALDAEHDSLALCRWREACGYEPHPRSRQVRAWLATATIRPVLGLPAADVPRLRFDLSAAVPGRPGDAAGVSAAMAAAGARLGVGGYGEDRDVYTAELFAGTERRTVHLGVDLFAPPGTDVYAPLDGQVAAVADNRAPQDYGPVILLQHRTGDGTTFFTLYGHLSRASLAGMRPGRPVWAGERIASIGPEQENGGWPPHLHLQVLLEEFGLGTDVPGVARRSERELWQSVCPDPNLLVGLPEGDERRPCPAAAEIAAQRAVRLSGALSLSYAEPLHIVRGDGAHLIDQDGRRWLDLVNNVAHVGHAHPRVGAAAAAQQARLNTNTRYLHASPVQYARRLAGTLPDPLSVVFLVNSGSEANDLALRLAYAHTGGRDVVVLEGAYHGNLSTLVDVSPYKFDGPGGSGRPEHTHVVPLPDAYRGRHGPDPDGYLADLEQRIAAASGRGRRLAGLLAEAIPGTAGQVMLADGFLAGAYRRVRAAGGVCIADEVQTGFGRVGSAFWAFEQHGVVPDVVTLGKPIGNGHPIGAVVTTPQVARSFDRGMEYFNTFGGNPVSAEIGLCVLDVIADERLQRAALVRGEQLLAGLREIAGRRPGVGDVRGSGLVLGVELVAGDGEPDPALAARVVEAAKAGGVLLSRDGIHQNVLKLKPPMVLDEADCRLALRVVDAALAQG
jgi:4-aminobutyrate aminotransferase-like enzyme